MQNVDDRKKLLLQSSTICFLSVWHKTDLMFYLLEWLYAQLMKEIMNSKLCAHKGEQTINRWVSR